MDVEQQHNSISIFHNKEYPLNAKSYNILQANFLLIGLSSKFQLVHAFYMTDNNMKFIVIS